MHKSATGSLRKNEGKPETTQIDPRFILALADLMTQSAKKYGVGNYAKGQEFRTPIDSMFRHLLKFLSGEDCDEESGLHHSLHIAANAMILYSSVLKAETVPELDNRIPEFK